MTPEEKAARDAVAVLKRLVQSTDVMIGRLGELGDQMGALARQLASISEAVGGFDVGGEDYGDDG